MALQRLPKPEAFLFASERAGVLLTLQGGMSAAYLPYLQADCNSSLQAAECLQHPVSSRALPWDRKQCLVGLGVTLRRRLLADICYRRESILRLACARI